MDLRAVLITLAIFVAVIVCAESDDKDAERQSSDASAAAAEKRRIFRYGRGGSILRFGKRGAIFRYGRGADDSDDNQFLGLQIDGLSDGEVKRRIFRYGKRPDDSEAEKRRVFRFGRSGNALGNGHPIQARNPQGPYVPFRFGEK